MIRSLPHAARSRYSPAPDRGGRFAAFLTVVFFIAGAFAFVVARFGAASREGTLARLAAVLAGADLAAAASVPAGAAFAAEAVLRGERPGLAACLPLAPPFVPPLARCVASSSIAASSENASGSAPRGSEAWTPSWL